MPNDRGESILQEAQRLIHGPRNKNYGHPRENFKDIALLFSAYLEKEITDIDVANLMILVKIARVKGTDYHRDSFTDIAGYAGCVERIYEEDPSDSPDTPGPQTKTEDESIGSVFSANETRKELGIPRQWPSLYLVPPTVKVRDRDGDLYEYKGGWYREGSPDPLFVDEVKTKFNQYAPFTEVLQ